MAEQIPLFNPQSAREFLFAPSADEDKYRRGVVGVVAGSDTYPGAGLLAAFAASNTGVGMVRLNSTRRVEDLVLHYAPGVVTVGGRIQSGVIGPGCTNERDDCRELAQFCIDSTLPLLIDAGALDLVRGLIDYADTHSRSLSRTILTPHHGEAARLLTQLGSPHSRADVDADPAASAKELASLTGAIILLKSRGARRFPRPTAQPLRALERGCMPKRLFGQAWVRKGKRAPSRPLILPALFQKSSVDCVPSR